MHGLAQPRGLHRREARQARRDRALGRLGHRRAEGDRERRRAGARGRPARVDLARRTSARRSARRRSATSTPLRSSRSRSSSTAATAWPGRWSGPLLDSFPIEQERTYWEPDGTFPDHEPNPLLEENRRFIIERVRETGADLGIAWDGDADRCFFIDDTGEFVAGDFLTALLAESILRKEPGATILYDVRASRAVRDLVEAAGGTAEGQPRRATRSSRRACATPGAAFGGEVSGHYYFRDFYCADSGTLPALLMLELLSVEGSRLSELLEPLRSKYFISGEINSEVEDQDGKMKELAERYSDGEMS